MTAAQLYAPKSLARSGQRDLRSHTDPFNVSAFLVDGRGEVSWLLSPSMGTQIRVAVRKLR
ncbi:hypothetical protein PHBOTO_005630 [Pseudozyma hubeiensis]|nr:hypothetical protein PHBOTO_005630 [Pseudozyma hubeiensis]